MTQTIIWTIAILTILGAALAVVLFVVAKKFHVEEDLTNDKVTILQAISLARDLTIFGERENVCVIREREGERVIYEINLCDVSMFNSPAYYLQQNDVVYVQPSQIKARQSTTDDKALRLTSIFVSGGSLLVSIAALIVNLVR